MTKLVMATVSKMIIMAMLKPTSAKGQPRFPNSATGNDAVVTASDCDEDKVGSLNQCYA